jgi:dihydrofolate synthase/folylpolyglutamate synthase
VTGAGGSGAARPSDPGWRAYLEALAVFGMRPGLERVTALLDGMGRPQERYRVIHVVGTNGKSSTTRYCEALLRGHGLRSGAYLSPHISGWSERVIVDGRPVGDATFGDCVERVRAAVPALPAALGETTQFEVLTVAALLAFAECGAEAVALEAGLGGRLDATNVVTAPVVVLTGIGLEHTQVLGETREEIFAEKAAVIKGGDVVFGPLEGLEAAARAVCAAVGARPHFLQRGDEGAWRGAARAGDKSSTVASSASSDAGVPGHDGDPGDLVVRGGPGDFSVTLLGEASRPAEVWRGLGVPTPALYQVTNAGLAVAAVRLLLGRLDEAAARRALAATPVPGRLQKVGEAPLVLADGAHNPDGARALVDSLQAIDRPRPRVAVLAIMRDKGVGAMLAELLPVVDAVVCSRASEPRSLSAEELAEALRAVAAGLGRAAPEALVEPDPHEALAAARRRATPAGSVLITGSLYLLEDLRDVLAAAGRDGAP